MAHGPSSEPGPTERALAELPNVELLGLLRRSSNYTFLARLTAEQPAPDGDQGMLAVYKPAEGETPLWDFPEGSLYRREVAAYRLARALGWPRIPPTIVRRSAPHGVGAMQAFVEARPDGHFLASSTAPERTWFEVALFDVITNNADRKSGHCLTDGSGAVWVIDHGLTFHVEPKLRTVIWDFAGRRVPPSLRADVNRVAAELRSGELGAELAEMLDEHELAVLSSRLASVAGSGWRMPHPTSGWSVPWPPV